MSFRCWQARGIICHIAFYQKARLIGKLQLISLDREGSHVKQVPPRTDLDEHVHMHVQIDSRLQSARLTAG